MRPGPLLNSIVRTGPGSALGVDTLDLGCNEVELQGGGESCGSSASIHAAVQPRTTRFLPSSPCAGRSRAGTSKGQVRETLGETSGGGGQRDGPEFHPLGSPLLSGVEVDLGPMNCGQRMRLCSTCVSPAQDSAERGSFLRGRTFPQEQSVACLPGMNLGVGQPGQAWRCPAAARRYQSGTFCLPHSWG